MNRTRKIDPGDIVLPPQCQIEVFADGLNAPINLVIAANGDMYLADAGVTDGNGKVLRYTGRDFAVVADGFTPPLTGIQVHDGVLYVSHRGAITRLTVSGKKETVISGLPSWGDHHNNQVVFGPDGKMYFGQGTATNSGVVGTDNSWVKNHPYFHDHPGRSVRLTGQNFATENVLIAASDHTAYTGAFSPFGTPVKPGEKIRGMVAASGSVLRANPDGSHLELVAWGLRNPFRMKFDRKGRLYTTNHGMDERGSRPVANSPDEFHRIRPGAWYGWPDYTGGQPVTNPHFRSDNHPQPSFLLTQPVMTPQMPISTFAPHSAAMGFDFNRDPQFGLLGEAYIAEFGPGSPGTTGGKPSPAVGRRITRLNVKTGEMSIFAVNRSAASAPHSGGGGFERPIDVVFTNTGQMYVVDMGMSAGDERFAPNSGVIWKVTRR